MHFSSIKMSLIWCQLLGVLAIIFPFCDSQGFFYFGGWPNKQLTTTTRAPAVINNRPPRESLAQFGRPGPCECGKSNLDTKHSRVVGGTEALPGEFPWRVSLLIGQASCAGTIITREWILTAAHCFRGYYPGQTVEVLVGGVGGVGFTAYPAQFLRHEDYDSRTEKNDIALLKLYQRKLEFRSGQYRPICLPFKLDEPDIVGKVWASGWGVIYRGGPPSNRLLKAPLDIIDNQQCQRLNGDFVFGSSGLQAQIYETQICTFTPGKDTCQGDSGGSLDYYDGGKWYAVGIVSWGIECARDDRAGVNTRVTEYLDWIVEETGVQGFCRN